MTEQLSAKQIRALKAMRASGGYWPAIPMMQTATHRRLIELGYVAIQDQNPEEDYALAVLTPAGRAALQEKTKP